MKDFLTFYYVDFCDSVSAFFDVDDVLVFLIYFAWNFCCIWICWVSDQEAIVFSYFKAVFCCFFSNILILYYYCDAYAYYLYLMVHLFFVLQYSQILSYPPFSSSCPQNWHIQPSSSLFFSSQCYLHHHLYLIFFPGWFPSEVLAKLVSFSSLSTDNTKRISLI